MSKVDLRDGAAADIEAIMTVMTRAFDPAFGEGWSWGQCLGILSLPDVWLGLADCHAEAIGFALSRVTVNEAELLLLAVTPDARGHGIGTALIEHSARAAAARGAARLLLEVRESNAAVGLYRRAGFAEIGRRRDYYRGADGTSYDALTLARALPSAARHD